MGGERGCGGAAVKLKQLGSLEVEKRVPMPLFDGNGLTPSDHARLGLQMQKVRDLMLDGRWRTLDEIGAATGAPPASASARLRDFRKLRNGRLTVLRRRRSPGLFEYQVTRGTVAP